MRMLRFLISYALFSIFGIVLSLFIAQNARVEHIAFYGFEFSTNLGLVMVAAAAFGFVLALLLLFPSRVAAALHSRSLDREAAQLERRLELLYDQRERLLSQHEALLVDHEELLFQYQRLLAGHSRVLAERDHARKALSSASTADSGKQAIPILAAPATPPARGARQQINGAASAPVTPPPASAPVTPPPVSRAVDATGESIGLGKPSERLQIAAPTEEPTFALAAPE